MNKIKKIPIDQIEINSGKIDMETYEKSESYIYIFKCVLQCQSSMLLHDITCLHTSIINNINSTHLSSIKLYQSDNSQCREHK
jgi:hypothetical protein